jgi:ATP-dependent Clp protease protease subunit
MSEFILDIPMDTLDPLTVQYYEGLKKRTFYITEEINENTTSLITIPLMEADNDGSLDPITIYINTPGGSVYDGFTLVSAIQQLKSPTKVIVLGYAYSMGALILMAGANNSNVTRYCYSFSTALMHGGSQLVQGSSSAVKDFFHFHEKYEKRIQEFVIAHSNITEEEYEKVDRYELYFDSDQMLEKGLVDEIL